jgi:hypothetical protein
MPLQKNTALRNDQADFLGGIFDGGTLEIYTGTQPGSPNSAPSGSLLATITIPNPAFGAAVAGVVEEAGSWTTTATDSGTAGWARFISADTLRTMDAVVTMVPGGNDLLISNTNVVSGNAVTVISLTLTTPES